MLGNDVVDLLDAESQPETFRPRFDERVFTEAERSEIAKSSRPLALRWALWSAKEAAYKLAKALYNNQKDLAAAHGIFRRFNPKKMAAVTSIVPFHPGAIKFYKEVGIWPARK